MTLRAMIDELIDDRCQNEQLDQIEEPEQVEELEEIGELDQLEEPGHIEELDLSDAEEAALEELETGTALVSAQPAMHEERFSYSDCSSAQIEECEAAVERIRATMRDSVIEMGHELNRVKDTLKHGQFSDWLAHYFPMSERTAQNCMSAARVFGSTPQIVDHLTPSTIYKLAAKGTPTEVKQAVVDQIVAGTTPDLTEIEKRIAVAKELQRQKKREERDRQTTEREVRKWERKEAALRKAGSSDSQIDAARKSWETKKAQKEREREKKLRTRERKIHTAQRETEEWNKQHEEHQRLAQKMVDLLKSHLGAEFETFRDLINKCNPGYLHRALEVA